MINAENPSPLPLLSLYELGSQVYILYARELRDLSGESDHLKRKDLMPNARNNPRKKMNLDTNHISFIKINSK